MYLWDSNNGSYTMQFQLINMYVWDSIIWHGCALQLPKLQKYAWIIPLFVMYMGIVLKFFQTRGSSHHCIHFLSQNIGVNKRYCVPLVQVWTNSSPRAKCGPLQRFQWSAEAFRKYVQIWNYLQLITVNVSVEANLTKTCFYFH